MAINKVEYVENGVARTLIDLTTDTVAIANVEEGITFHLPNGVNATGTGRYAVPIDVSTEQQMDALLVSSNEGKCYKYTGTTTSTYVNGNLYIVEVS